MIGRNLFKASEGGLEYINQQLLNAEPPRTTLQG